MMRFASCRGYSRNHIRDHIGTVWNEQGISPARRLSHEPDGVGDLFTVFVMLDRYDLPASACHGKLEFTLHHVTIGIGGKQTNERTLPLRNCVIDDPVDIGFR